MITFIQGLIFYLLPQKKRFLLCIFNLMLPYLSGIMGKRVISRNTNFQIKDSFK